jgi:hypothetical protein
VDVDLHAARLTRRIVARLPERGFSNSSSWRGKRVHGVPAATRDPHHPLAVRQRVVHVLVALLEMIVSSGQIETADPLAAGVMLNHELAAI